MSSHRIPQDYVETVCRRRRLAVGALTFVVGTVAMAWREQAATVMGVVIPAAGAVGLAIGRGDHPYAQDLAERARWEIVCVPGALEFRKQASRALIAGRDVQRLRVGYRSGALIWIDVRYGGVWTRIRHYQGLGRILLHLRGIASAAIAVEETRR